jgi:HSP20 family molecular chaperone IbpA
MAEVEAQPHGERTGEATRNAPVFVPLADIFETSDALHLSLELPGVDSEDLNITLDKRVLTITGRCRQAHPPGYSASHTEYRIGDYERTFTLSETIDADRIQAEFKDGLLGLKLPKAQPAPAKTINVKATG